MSESREQYYKEHPERKGEEDKAFDDACYIEWLEAKNKKLEEKVKELEEERLVRSLLQKRIK